MPWIGLGEKLRDTPIFNDQWDLAIDDPEWPVEMGIRPVHQGTYDSMQICSIYLYIYIYSYMCINKVMLYMYLFVYIYTYHVGIITCEAWIL